MTYEDYPEFPINREFICCCLCDFQHISLRFVHVIFIVTTHTKTPMDSEAMVENQALLKYQV